MQHTRNPWNKPKDWTGIYSIDPSTGSIAFKNSQYLKVEPEEISIIVRDDAERFEAAKKFLSEHGVPFTAGDFSKTRNYLPAQGTITVRKDQTTALGEAGTRQLYHTIIAFMDGKLTQEKSPGRLEPEYAATDLHEKLFGPLLIHPLTRAKHMGQPQYANAWIKDMFERGRSPEEISNLITTYLDCYAHLKLKQKSLDSGSKSM